MHKPLSPAVTAILAVLGVLAILAGCAALAAPPKTKTTAAIQRPIAPSLKADDVALGASSTFSLPTHTYHENEGTPAKSWWETVKFQKCEVPSNAKYTLIAWQGASATAKSDDQITTLPASLTPQHVVVPTNGTTIVFTVTSKDKKSFTRIRATYF